MKALTALIAAFFIGTSHISCQEQTEHPTLDEYIAHATQEWAASIDSLEPYQLQILANYLYLLFAQARCTIDVERHRAILTRKTHLITQTLEKQENSTLPLSMVVSCCGRLIPLAQQLQLISATLIQCQDFIATLNKDYSAPIKNALDAVTAMGRIATTHKGVQYKENIQAFIEQTAQKTETIAKYIQTAHNFCTGIKKDPQLLFEENNDDVSQFYAVYGLLGKCANKGWELVDMYTQGLDGHLAFVRICTHIFDVCYTAVYEHLSHEGISDSYRTILFSPSGTRQNQDEEPIPLPRPGSRI